MLCLIRGDIASVKLKFIGTIMSNGGWPDEMFGAGLPFIGPIWFFLALYWCKIFYEYLKHRTDKCLLYSFVISTIALIIGKYIVNLPFGILTGFCGMIFYCMGDYWRNKLEMPIKTTYFIGGLFVWAICIRIAHLELASFNCSLYPISMFAAFVGTYTTYLVSKKMPLVLRPLFIWIGQNTLLILCYHTLYFYILDAMNHFIFKPNGIVVSSAINLAISFALSLGLPFLHTIIYKQLSKK